MVLATSIKATGLDLDAGAVGDQGRRQHRGGDSREDAKPGGAFDQGHGAGERGRNSLDHQDLVALPGGLRIEQHHWPQDGGQVHDRDDAVGSSLQAAAIATRGAGHFKAGRFALCEPLGLDARESRLRIAQRGQVGDRRDVVDGQVGYRNS